MSKYEVMSSYFSAVVLFPALSRSWGKRRYSFSARWTHSVTTGRVTLRLTRIYQLTFAQEPSVCGRDESASEIFSPRDFALRCGTRALLTTE